jgi:hypothetical protein
MVLYYFEFLTSWPVSFISFFCHQNEGKYRARAQDLRERLNEAHGEIDQLRDSLALAKKASAADRLAAESSGEVHAREQAIVAGKLAEAQAERDALRDRCRQLEAALQDRERVVVEFSQRLTTSLPLIAAEIKILKTTMLADHAEALAEQRRTFEARIQEYREREMKREAIEHGIMLGRKRQFEQERKQELETMQRLREEEELLGAAAASSATLPEYNKISGTALPTFAGAGQDETLTETLQRLVSRLPAAVRGFSRATSPSSSSPSSPTADLDAALCRLRGNGKKNI